MTKAEIKTLILHKMFYALTAISSTSSTGSDKDASEAVLNLANAYEILDNLKSEGGNEDDEA